ncbi:MAG: electron transfer flavoprotein subunit beta/FixA family protein [SAR324 cluster bacterium]|nr:electron transfer flavoprotein subunit beta/FixA family protein [SAR324 cluster bacterium]
MKNVPDATATIRLADQTRINEDIPFEMNPSDEFAVEEALKLRESSETAKPSDECEVILLSYGPAGAESMLRHGLAMGADRAIHIKDENQFSDSRKSTNILARAIEFDGQPDLILTGSRASDSEGMQTPYRLAAYFDFPVSSNIIHCEFQNDRAKVHRELDEGDCEVLSIRRPCVLGIKHALDDPRIPKIRDMMKARKKEIQTLGLKEIGFSEEALSAFKKTEDLHSEVKLLKLELPSEKAAPVILEGEVKVITLELIRLLQEEAQVL